MEIKKGGVELRPRNPHPSLNRSSRRCCGPFSFYQKGGRSANHRGGFDNGKASEWILGEDDYEKSDSFDGITVFGIRYPCLRR